LFGPAIPTNIVTSMSHAGPPESVGGVRPGPPEPASPSDPASGGEPGRVGRVARLRAGWAAWRVAARGAWRALPPPPEELARATVVGALTVALTNAVAIAVSVRWPPGGAEARALHHLFDALGVVGLGAWLALPFAAAALFRDRVPSRGPVVLAGWLAFAALATAGLGWMLAPHLERQAHAALDGRYARAILVAYHLGCGLALPAAYLLGAFGARVGGAAGALVLGAAVGGIAVAHLILRDDYPAVHAAILWVAGAGAGARLAPACAHWLAGARRRPWVVVLAAAGAAAVIVAPPNETRLEIAREPGGVAAWILGQLVWERPSIRAHARSPEIVQPSAEEARRAAIGMPAAPVVVLVTVDALRADVLASGAHDARLPELVRLRTRGAYFPHAVAPGAQTSVSLSTMFTGRYFSSLEWQPHGRGRTRFLYPAVDPTPRFPELLGRAGVGTASFIGLIFLSSYFGLTRGFAEETVVVTGRQHAHAQAVMGPLLARLDRLGDGEPFFAYVHLMDAHEPYDRGRVKQGPAFARYLSEVEVVDRWIGKLARVLRQRFPGRGYLLVSADHGEAFGEHGTHFHTKTLYEELVSVPLILWGPGIGARRWDQVRAGLVDVGPTVLAIFGMPPPEGSMGASLLPLVRGVRKDLVRPLFAEGRLRRAFFAPDGLKVIEDTVRKTVEIYDLVADPTESRNLFDGDRARAEPAVAALRAFFERHELRRHGYRPPFKP
jgi:hypothetical protein